MRREIGYILAGLGTFLIVVAVALPVYVAPGVIKWPLNQYLATTLLARDASYFSAQTLKEVSGVTVEADYTFKGDAARGNSSTAVWDEFNYVHDVTNNVRIQIGSRTFAFDRKTAQLIMCCGASVDGHRGVRQAGLAGYAFPIGTRKQTYLVFDATAGRPEPFTYSVTATVRGIETYVFTENVAPTPAIDEPVPADYQNDVRYYVDPVTGIPLDITEHEILTAQSGGTTLFDANLAMTSSTVSSLVSIDNKNRSEITLLRLVLPLASGILGAVLLVAGVLLVRRGPAGKHGRFTAHETEPPTLSQESARPPAADDVRRENPDRTGSRADPPTVGRAPDPGRN